MKRMPVVLAAVVVIGVTYVAGYWPERQGRLATVADLVATRAELERTQARNRLYGLQSRIVDLRAAVEARNFGAAQDQATILFDEIRRESDRPDQSEARSRLQAMAEARDDLTVALTQNDSVAIEMLHDITTRLREALGDSPATVETAKTPPPAVLPG